MTTFGGSTVPPLFGGGGGGGGFDVSLSGTSADFLVIVAVRTPTTVDLYTEINFVDTFSQSIILSNAFQQAGRTSMQVNVGSWQINSAFVILGVPPPGITKAIVRGNPQAAGSFIEGTLEFTNFVDPLVTRTFRIDVL